MSVYFIRDANVPEVKIGYSGWVDHRLNTLRSQTRRELQLLRTIPGDMKDEKALHRRFQEYRIEGEWFRLEGKLARFIGRKRPAKLKPIAQVFRESIRDMLKAGHSHEHIAETFMMTVPVLLDYMKTNNLK